MDAVQKNMEVVSKIQDLTNLVEEGVKRHLKDMVKEKLMKHAEEVVDEVATQIAENLASTIESYNMMTGDVQVNLWLGPKDATRKMKREVKYTVEK